MSTGSDVTEQDEYYDAIYKALEPYDIKHVLGEAAYKCVLSEDERKEIEQQGRSRRKMREHLVQLIISEDGKRLQKFVKFIRNYASHVQKMSTRALSSLPQNCWEQKGASLSQSVDESSSASSDSSSATEIVN